MDWSRLIQLVLPLIIKLLQGWATLPPEGQRHMAEALTAQGPEDNAFNSHVPQPGEQFAQQAASADIPGALPRRHVQPGEQPGQQPGQQ